MEITINNHKEENKNLTVEEKWESDFYGYRDYQMVLRNIQSIHIKEERMFFTISQYSWQEQMDDISRHHMPIKYEQNGIYLRKFSIKLFNVISIVHVNMKNVIVRGNVEFVGTPLDCERYVRSSKYIEDSYKIEWYT